ncbi:hypothetical protein ZOSMA_180G00290 [Zostera marina]|uniref:Uncharacterized protein n=1 Tax=Zostera marina TaxID=29655 RepID=A0A0K9PQU2_ZOSMR|nr:hypothetical protein ZOSMA_180G00290 [Zostera marina]
MAMELRINVSDTTDWASLLRPNPNVNICRIPTELVEANGNVDREYAPKYISIGPYHYGKEELRSMQKVKLQYLNDLLARNKSNTIERYMDVVKNVDLSSEKNKYCDFGVCGISDDIFLGILLLDGCFLVELLLKHNDGSLTFPGIDIHKLNHDLMLIENQIPFPVLKLIYQNTDLVEPDQRFNLFDLAINYLHNGEKSIDGVYEEIENMDHLLHLLYMCRLNRVQLKNAPSRMKPWLYRLLYILVATLLLPIFFTYRYHEKVDKDFLWKKILLLSTPSLIIIIILKESGILYYLWEGISFLFVGIFYLVIIWVEAETKYTAKSVKTNCPLIHGLTQTPTVTEIAYSGINWLGIGPTVTYKMFFKPNKMHAGLMEINDNSFSEFENLLFYEQIYFLPRLPENEENDALYISTYAVYMRNMVKTESDVIFLRKHGVLKSTSSLIEDKEITSFFRKQRPWLVLTKLNQKNIGSQFRSLEKFCSSGHRKRKAKLRKEYFVSTVVIFAFLGFVIVTAFTAAQTVYAIRGDKKD